MTKALMLITYITIHNRRNIFLLYTELKVFISLLVSSCGFPIGSAIKKLRLSRWTDNRRLSNILYNLLYTQDIVMITSNPFHLGQDSIWEIYCLTYLLVFLNAFYEWLVYRKSLKSNINPLKDKIYCECKSLISSNLANTLNLTKWGKKSTLYDI